MKNLPLSLKPRPFAALWVTSKFVILNEVKNLLLVLNPDPSLRSG